jgi:molecular chaperone GrpE (heat shock protein)
MKGGYRLIPIKPESSNFSEKVIRIPVRRAVEEGTHDLPDAESPDSLSNGAANKALPIPDPDERHALARQLVDASASGEEVRARLMELEAQHRNVLADSDNFRKRIEREARQQILNEKRAFLLELLEIMDNFERALRINPDGNDAWRQGVEATHGQMVELLERHGVRPIETLGALLIIPM